VTRPLDDVRVLDLGGGFAGAMATLVLADFGADVLLLEPSGGDPLRRHPAWPLLGRGKRSAILEVGTSEGRARLDALCAETDVMVSTLAPREAEARGLDARCLRSRHPRLIHCSITGFGPRGPYAHYPAIEGIAAAKSGRMGVFAGQRPRPGPQFAAVEVATHAAAQGAVQGIVAALLARERSGEGAQIETNLLQGLLPYDLVQMILVQLAERDERFQRPPVPVDGMPTLNYHPVLTRDDRWIQLGNLLEHLFYAFLDAIELLPELLSDARFQGSPAAWSREAIEEARNRILLRVRERTADEWMRRFHENGNVAAEPYTSAQEALDHRDLVANGDIVELNDPERGRVRTIGPIARLRETPGEANRPAPRLGEHAPEFQPRETTRAKTQSGAPRRKLLEGITVVEFATIIAAPLGTAMLADLGARVIKIEPPGGDPYRQLGLAGLMAVKTNAGKESLCLDLKSTEGQAIAQALVQRADALVHNYRPGVPERLGIGYEQLRAHNPRLVWVSANGYGPDSPSRLRPSAHPVPGAVAGGALYQAGAGIFDKRCETLLEIRETARQLMRANEPNPDPNTSVVIASATVLALLARERHGVGQQVFVNMLVANAYANAQDFLSYAGKPERPPVDSELHGLHAGYRLYPAGEGWVFLAALQDADWTRTFAVLGCAERAHDPRFASAEARRAHDAELVELLTERFALAPADDWERRCIAEGVACVRADGATPGAFFARDPHVLANGMAPEAIHARFGRLRRWGPLVTLEGSPADFGPGALAGEHTDRLLRELGKSPAEIARLRAERVVDSEPAALDP
jgi:crotonobetainyl-CoA:carnitine CoA-transferase CaiB-like acyl-CoA transferase